MKFIGENSFQQQIKGKEKVNSKLDMKQISNYSSQEKLF